MVSKTYEGTVAGDCIKEIEEGLKHKIVIKKYRRTVIYEMASKTVRTDCLLRTECQKLERGCRVRFDSYGILFDLNKIVRLQVHSCSCFIQHQDDGLSKTKAIPYNFSTIEFLPISFKIQQLETSPQKQMEQRQKQLGADKLVSTQIWRLKNLMSLFSDVFSLPVHFQYYAIFKS
jgi:hypothetical protein